MATGPQNFKEKELTAFTARGHDFSDCSEREREWEGEEGEGQVIGQVREAAAQLERAG